MSEPTCNRRAGHCWHVLGSYANCLQSAGGETVMCCFCDARRDRTWTTRPDPAHGPYGPYGPFKIRVYDDEARKR